MRLIIAILLPWLLFFTIGRPLAGIICLIGGLGVRFQPDDSVALQPTLRAGLLFTQVFARVPIDLRTGKAAPEYGVALYVPLED